MLKSKVNWRPTTNGMTEFLIYLYISKSTSMFSMYQTIIVKRILLQVL